MSALRVVKALWLKCERCPYEWLAKVPPKRCPRCKSPYWNVKRGKLPKGRLPKAKPGGTRRSSR